MNARTIAKPAAPRAAAKSNGASSITMELGEIITLYNVGIGNLSLGLAGLNGYNKAVGERIMLQPFSLTDEVRQKITHAKFILRPFFDEVYKEERARITTEVMGDEEALYVPQEDQARQAMWAHLEQKALKVKHTIHGLHIFKREDFFRENKNPIPNETEIALYPITEGSPWRLQYAAAAEVPPVEEVPPGGEN